MIGVYIGLAGVAFFAVSGGFSMAAMNVGGGLMLIGLACQGRAIEPALLREPLVLSLLVLIAYILLRAGTAVWQAEAGSPHWEEAWDLIRACGLMAIFLGGWLYARPAWIRIALVLAAISGVVAIIFALCEATRVPWDAGVQLDGNARLQAYGSANAFGTYTAFFLVGLFALAPAVVGRYRSPWRWWMAAAWVVFGLLPVSLALLWSGSRSAWMGAAVGILFALLLEWRPRLASFWRGHRAGASGAVALLVVLGGLGVVMFADVASWRLGVLWESIDVLIAGDWAAIPDWSLRLRMHIWQGGIEAIRERPWLGWGPGGLEEAMVASAHPAVREFSHFHNLVLNLWVALGAVGVASVTVCVALTVHAVARLLRTDTFPRELVVLAASGLLTFTVISLFQIRYNDPTGVVPNSLFIGILIAGVLKYRTGKCVERMSRR